jgi:carboxyl-terminal processing protease
MNFACLKAQLNETQHFEVSKNLDIFNSVFKELNLFYVDSIDAKTAIQTGIESMLETLDPYTEYISEDQMADFKFKITGEYAGIGAVITFRDGKILIMDPYEGMPAARSGLQAGDQILEIDGESLAGKSSADASEKLKGQPGSKVKIKYLRQGTKKPVTIEIERERIHLSPITYYGVLDSTIGYIALSNFTDQCFQDFRAAFVDLKKNHGITSLIIDLRNNPGGIMEEALQIVNMFVPKGKVLLSTKGKVKQWDRVFRATQNPVDLEIPLVVMVNRGSASASEIVAGALQDLDRAVIVGRRSYGKGLVQTPRDLPYNAQLKITTSKYYIPSGRCVQAIDYAHRNPEGYAERIPDSLTTVFYTENRRPVRDGGGVNPDFIVAEERIPTISFYMDNDGIFFDFVVQWRILHPEIATPFDFQLSDADYEEFKRFVKEKHFDYDRQSGKALQALKEIMVFEGYMNTASEEYALLEKKLQPDLDRDLELYKPQLKKILASEIMNQYYYWKGKLIHSLYNDDSDLNKAIEIVKDKSLYDSTLKPAITDPQSFNPSILQSFSQLSNHLKNSR